METTLSHQSRRRGWCLLLFALVAAPIILLSCYPGGPESIGELDLVATFYDPDLDYGANRTYAMPDSILHIKDEENPDNNVDLSRDHDDFILSKAAEHMQGLGYSRIAEPDTNNVPDVVILISAIGRKNFVITPGYPWYPGWGYWPGWGYCPGCWGPGWGYWYPWTPPTVTSYQSGTLYIDMFDADSRDEDRETLTVIWNASINGALGGGSSSTRIRLNDTITQAFTQSPYLESRQ
jgi:hypothetical protein